MPTTNSRSVSRRLVLPLLAALATASAGSLFAQTTPAAQPANTAAGAATASEDETVYLSPFNISAAPTSRYQASEATSGARVRVALLDSTQSVSVVTRDLINDIGAGRLIDAAKYVAGVYESTIPNAQDRTTIRGFQNDGATVDGFSYFSFANLDPIIVDRIEVVKGPNAILAPQGVPGGTINAVSKKPTFKDQGYVSYQVGQYGSNRGELDVNRVAMDGKLALRVVGAIQDADDYGDGNFHRSNIGMPMLTYRFGPSTQLTLQAEFYNWRALNYGGVPVSLYADSGNTAHILDGLPTDFVAQGPEVTRSQSAQHYRAFFTTSFTENLSMRVAANFIKSNAESVQLNIGAAPNQVIKVDPATGLWHWDGTTRNDAPTFSLGGSVNQQNRDYANLQNDFVYELHTDSIKSTTVFGYAINYAATLNEKNQNFTVPSPADFRNYKWTGYTLTNITGINTRYYRDQQVYLSEVLGLFHDSVLLSAGVSRNWYFSENIDLLLKKRVSVSPNATLPSAGVVFKVLKNTSLYYGYSEQATAVNPSVTATNFFDTQTSKQHEFGIRTQQFDNRLYATLAYFKIKQDNFSVPNPLNSAVPVPSPLLPPLFSNRLAHGLELELNYAVTKNLSIVGNGTLMKNRDADGVPFRGTAEKAAAVWVNYTFNKSTPMLDGLSLGIGVDYLSRRAGDTASGVTSASTPDQVIRVQPSFWLPARALVNASASYRFLEHWRAQLNIDNLLDKDYLAASTSRTSVWAGTPFNAKLTVSYNF
ncbi:MAG TPA: TonB-dependent receptor [Opitutaceae bacterium]|nr:TonB-dependent receptor [Opitutaceae bacterium]